MTDCLFCKIIKGDIPANKVYEDERYLAFLDIAPQAEKHILLIPKQHLASLNELDHLDDEGLAGLIRLVPSIAKKAEISDSGYRLVSNCGPHAKQSVGHLHLHILGGQELSAQMG